MAAPVGSSLQSFAQANLANSQANSASQPGAAEKSGARFSDALASALNAQSTVQEKGAATAPADAVDAAARARKALHLDGPSAAAPSAESGDVVLNGLTKLHGVVDDQVSGVLRALSNAVPTTTQLYAMQAQFSTFSVKMDIASKLASKGTQAFESLLKGQ